MFLIALKSLILIFSLFEDPKQLLSLFRSSSSRLLLNINSYYIITSEIEQTNAFYWLCHHQYSILQDLHVYCLNISSFGDTAFFLGVGSGGPLEFITFPALMQMYGLLDILEWISYLPLIDQRFDHHHFLRGPLIFADHLLLVVQMHYLQILREDAVIYSV